MRRSLEFGRWLSRWWMQQANNRTAITSHLEEGLKAYSAEMADMEERRCISWAMTWAGIRDRARLILETYLHGDKEGDGILMPKLTVEINIEDGHELLDESYDTD
jgi:hypothetical protein